MFITSSIFMSWLLMFINASPDSHSLDMVNLRCFFNLLSVLNERSHSADVIGNMHKMQIKVWMLGKNSQSRAVRVCTGGKVGILSAAPLSITGAQHKPHEEMEGCSQNSSTASTSGFLSPMATSSVRRLNRLDKTASLVGLKYVFISDCK